MTQAMTILINVAGQKTCLEKWTRQYTWRLAAKLDAKVLTITTECIWFCLYDTIHTIHIADYSMTEQIIRLRRYKKVKQKKITSTISITEKKWKKQASQCTWALWSTMKGETMHDARTSPVVSTNRLANSLKNLKNRWLGHGTPLQSEWILFQLLLLLLLLL